MDVAPVMIWVSNTDKQCVWFNRPWLNFTGRDIQQELGDGWLEGVHPEDTDRCLQTYISHFDARKEFRPNTYTPASEIFHCLTIAEM